MRKYDGNLVISAIFSYVSLILLLRVVGNKTLSQLNAFDFIVAVGLGSTLATMIVSKDVAPTDGLLALVCQSSSILIRKASTTLKFFRKMIKTEPFLLFFNGSFLQNVFHQHRITKDKIICESSIPVARQFSRWGRTYLGN